jgi:uncharacterized ion transporter superfamily protein YfcC
MKLRMPHPMTLLVVGIFIAALFTWVLPAGEFQRTEDAATGREVVVAGTYREIERSPVGPFDAIVAIPRGMAEAADVIFLVFLVGGAFAVVDATGALRRGVNSLVQALRGRGLIAIPIVGLFFATGGAVENMQEEIIALVPVLLLLTARLGYTPLVAVAMSLGAAIVGSAFSPINPFQVQIAQKLAGVPLLSGGLFRFAFLVPAVGIWLGMTMRYAHRNRVPVADLGVVDDEAPGRNAGIVMALVGLAFAVYIYGLERYEWGFDHLSAIFFIVGVLAGIIGGLGAEGTARAFVNGFREMTFAALLIGFARAIYVVLRDGHVIDTIVNGLFTPLADMPQSATLVGMWGMHSVLHVMVPSVSGQAVLTMPILAPLSDLLDISRNAMILAYQYGAGLCELLTPTNGSLVAIVAAAGVRFGDWIRFALPLWGLLVVLGLVSVFVAQMIGL